MPETLRVIVGNGSMSAPPWNRPLLPIIGRGRKNTELDTRPPPRPLRNPLHLFTHPDVLVLLIFNAIIYSVFYAVSTTIAADFGTAYPFLNETEIGVLLNWAPRLLNAPLFYPHYKSVGILAAVRAVFDERIEEVESRGDLELETSTLSSIAWMS